MLTVRDWIRRFVTEMNRAHVFSGHGLTLCDEALSLVFHSLSLPTEEVDFFFRGPCFT